MKQFTNGYLIVLSLFFLIMTTRVSCVSGLDLSLLDDEMEVSTTNVTSSPRMTLATLDTDTDTEGMLTRPRRDADDTRCTSDAPVEEASVLNATTFLGLNPSIQQRPLHCSDLLLDSAGVWGPQVNDNLRAECPWRCRVKDLGYNTFPRFVQEAECLGTTCVNHAMSSCHNVFTQLTVFEKTGCVNGLAILAEKRVTLTIGCSCWKPSPNSIN